MPKRRWTRFRSRRSRPPSATTCATTSTPAGWRRRASPSSFARRRGLPMRAVVFGFTLLLASACRSRSEEVVVYTSVDDLYSKRIFEAFTKETGIRVLPVFDTEEAKTLGLVH